MIKLIKIKKVDNKYKLFIKINSVSLAFYSNSDNKSNIYNVLATLATINLFVDITKLSKDVFLDFKTPYLSNSRNNILLVFKIF